MVTAPLNMGGSYRCANVLRRRRVVIVISASSKPFNAISLGRSGFDEGFQPTVKLQK